MIVRLAWRNVWRNKTRSFAVILALTMGLFGALFLSSMSNGMADKWIKSSIDNEISDLQIHNDQYLIMEELNQTMDKALLDQKLKSNPDVKTYSTRVRSEGMAMTANNTAQVSLLGINPEVEKTVTEIYEKLEEGSYLDTGSSLKPILISKRLAEKLKVRLKSKIIFTMADMNGNVIYENFKVNGIFNTNHSMFDESTVFVRKSMLQEILKLKDNEVHEVAIRVKDPEKTDQVLASLTTELAPYKVRDWKEINPTLEVTSASMDLFAIILVSIVLIALIFGIINTMLMVILERTKEIGMLRALGMKRRKIALMITLETIFLCLVGGVAGNILALTMIEYFGVQGMHFESFKEGMEQFGMSSDIYPSLPYDFYFTITLMVFVTAVFSSIFPIIRAFKLNPALAIRD